MPISERMKTQIKRSSLIRKMFETAAQLKAERGEDAIADLSIGNPMAPPPDEFFATLRKIAAEPQAGAHCYNASNAGLLETRTAVAELLEEESGLPFTPQHILMSSGAAGALNVLCRALLDPDDEVIILAPYFSEYPYYADNYGGKVRIVETSADFQPDAEAVRAAVGPKTKIVIVNTPNNPTGEVYPQATLDRLGQVLQEWEAKLGRAIYLVSDEPYLRLLFDGSQAPSVLSAHDNTILVRSFSKDLSLAGERIGYIGISPRIDEPEELARGLGLAARVLGYVNAPTLMQRVVRHCLRASVDLDFYRRNRDFLYEALVDSGYHVRKPEGAFYLFPQVPGDGDDKRFCERAQQLGLLAVPGRGFGRAGYIRLSCAVTFETAQRGAEMLRKLARE